MCEKIIGFDKIGTFLICFITCYKLSSLSFPCIKELYELLIDELHKQLYVKSVSGVVKGFQRQGSQRQSGKKDKTSLVKQVLTGNTGEDLQGIFP